MKRAAVIALAYGIGSAIGLCVVGAFLAACSPDEVDEAQA
jgi:hypothetical protein